MHYLGHSRSSRGTWWSVFTWAQTFVSSVHPSFALPAWDDRKQPASPLASAWQTLSPLAPPNGSIYFHGIAERRCQRSFGVCGVGSGWPVPASLQRLRTRLLTCCVHVSGPPSSANPFQGECCYASQTLPESKRVFCTDMFFLTRRGGNLIFAPSVVRSCLGFLPLQSFIYLFISNT